LRGATQKDKICWPKKANETGKNFLIKKAEGTNTELHAGGRTAKKRIGRKGRAAREQAAKGVLGENNARKRTGNMKRGVWTKESPPK